MHTLQQCITAYRIDNFLPPFRQQRVDLKLNKITIFREETKSVLAGFHAPLFLVYLVELEFGDAAWKTGENPRSKARNNNKPHPHMAPDRNRTRATSIGGR